MDALLLEKIIEEFNKRNGLKLNVELLKIESYRLMVAFSSKGSFNDDNIPEDIIEFGNFLSTQAGADYDLIRLYRLGDGRFVGVFVPDSDRMKEVVDFGFDPFDMLL